MNDIEFTADNEVAQTRYNINLMLAEYRGREFMLEERQREFVESIRDYYKTNGRLSAKQFKWLVIYWSTYAGYSDWEGDPAYA